MVDDPRDASDGKLSMIPDHTPQMREVDMETRRAHVAFMRAVQAQSKVCEASQRAQEAVEAASNGVPLRPMDQEDSLVTTMDQLMQTSRSPRAERRAQRAKTQNER